MSSRKDEKERRRQERLAWENEQQQQARRKRMYSIGAGGVLVVAAAAAIIVAVAAGGGDGGGGSTDSQGGKELDVAAASVPEQREENLFRAARAANCRLSNPPIEGNTHLDPDAKVPNYKTNPPSSGNHDPVPATDNAYSDAPGIKHVVHSLEHGRIEIHYAPGISRRKLAQLKGLYDEDQYHIVLLPNETKMEGEVAVVAWGHVANCPKLTDETFDVIRSFTTRYRDKGPEFVP